MDNLKRCTKCEQMLPPTTEYFYHSKSHKDGLRSVCKPCCREKDREYYVSHREQKLAKSKQYRDTHREKNRAYARWYGKVNREKHLAQTKGWARRNPDKTRLAQRRYNQSHQDKVRQRDRNSKLRRRGAEGFHTTLDIQSLYETQQGHCAYCGVKLDNFHHVDHIYPISRGGSNWPENLAIACAHCNLSKRERLLYDEWTPPNPLPTTQRRNR